MSYFTDTYSVDIQPILSDWLNHEGGAVSDLPLNLANRAQKRLWERRPWDKLIKTADLTVDANRQADLPSDWGRTLAIYIDSDSDGLPDSYYYRNSSRVERRYTEVFTFTNAGGFTSKKIEFAQSPSGTPKIRYQAVLTNFAGTGTEYTYFPGHLVVLQAQVIHIAEKGWGDPNEAQAINKSFRDAIVDYEQCNQFQNAEWVMEQRDNDGILIENDSYNMDDGFSVGQGVYDNDYDMG